MKPASTVVERDGVHFVVAAGEIIAGPFVSNAAAWRWLDRRTGEPISRAEHVAEWLWRKMIDER
jgi:hypothetical protein